MYVLGKSKTKGKREKEKNEVTVQGRQPMLGHIMEISQPAYDSIELIHVAFHKVVIKYFVLIISVDN